MEGKLLYGLHMVHGVAEYNPTPDTMYRLLITDDAIKKMNPTFQGKPLFVEHRVSEDQAPDGYVVRSFFNEKDGKHWAEFMVTSKSGLDALSNGFVLSNGYDIEDKVGGGRWNGIDYDYEVVSAKFDHLALVGNPRYAESIVLTPDEFKEYNKNKSQEIERLQNSIEQENKKMQFNIFSRKKVENSVSDQLEGLEIELPKSKKVKTLTAIINEADEKAANEDKPQMVKINEKEEMPLNELVEKYNALVAEKAENESEEDKKENEDEDEKENESSEEKVEQAEDDKKENEDKKEDVKNSFNDIKKARKEKTGLNSVSNTIETSYDRMIRGKNRYGSK